jgi:predicted nucleotide-binding protein
MPPPRKKRLHKRPVRKGKPKVFIVHGQNVTARESVARFLEKIGCEAVILHELPSKGKTIFQKFTTYSSVDFAVVLLTGDDQGGRVGVSWRDQKKRARQNVILELGFFLAALGPDKVCPLYEHDVELPSDYAGVGWVPLDSSEKWKTLLARELESAGIRIDSKKLLTI